MLLIVHGGAGSRRPSLKALKRLAEPIPVGHSLLHYRDCTQGGAKGCGVVHLPR